MLNNRSATQKNVICQTAYPEVVSLPTYEAGWYSDAIRRKDAHVGHASQSPMPIGHLIIIEVRSGATRLYGYGVIRHELAQVLCDLDSMDSTQWAPTLIVLFHTSADVADRISGHVQRCGVFTWSWTQNGGWHSTVDTIWHQVLCAFSSCALCSHCSALPMSQWVIDYAVRSAPVHLLLQCCIPPHSRPLMLAQCPFISMVPWGFITPFDHQVTLILQSIPFMTIVYFQSPHGHIVRS